MGTISHASVGTRLTQTNWEDSDIHVDASGNPISLGIGVPDYAITVNPAGGYQLKTGATSQLVSTNADPAVLLGIAAASSGKIAFGPGTFTYATYGNLDQVSNIEVCGVGPATIFTQANGTNLGSFLYSTKDNIYLHDFALDGNGTNQTAATAAIRLRGAGQRYARLYISDTYGTTPSIMYDAGSDIWIVDCYLTNAGSLTSATGGVPTVNRVHVHRDHFIDPKVGNGDSVIGGSVAGYFITFNYTSNMANALGCVIDPAASIGGEIIGNIDVLTAGTDSFYCNGSDSLIIAENILSAGLRIDNSTNISRKNNVFTVETIVNSTLREKVSTSTGTGAEQTIAHGLSTTPSKVILSEYTTGGAGAYQSSAASTANIFITATLNKTYVWSAEV